MIFLRSQATRSFSFTHICRLTVIAATAFMLSGCPSPPLFKTWVKPDATENDVKNAMRDCGFPNAGSTTPQDSRNEVAKMYLCMHKRGYSEQSGFDICSTNRELPACIEEKQGSPVNISQLEALPFNDDPGFWPANSKLNFTPRQLIPWRPGNHSQHYSERISNQDLALAAMYECGYPKPLGSGSPASIATTARAQSCMQRKGFVPDRASIQNAPMIPVCQQYPMLPDCVSSAAKK
jgi:hypothetical protein